MFFFTPQTVRVRAAEAGFNSHFVISAILDGPHVVRYSAFGIPMNNFLIALALLLPQLPDIPTAAGPRVSVEGVVLGVGDAPVAGAEVSAFWSPAPAAYGSNQVPKTATDKDGHFLIKDLGAGGYRLIVRAGGYAYQEYGAKAGRTAGNGTVITLTPGQALSGITIRLVGEGVISGKVSSTNGQPLLGMEVYAFRKTFDAYGWPAMTPEGQRGDTNDKGEYRLIGLPPGTYYVRAASPFGGLAELAQARAAIQGAPVPGGTSPGQYADVFYPGVLESSKASLVETTSGGEIRNVDIALPRQPLYRIRGRAVDPGSSVPAERVMVGTVPARAEFVSGIGMSIRPYHPDGTFELEDLTPGSYWVRAQMPPPPMTPELRQLLATPGAERPNLPTPAMGIAWVDVIDSDVSNVEVRFVKDLHVDGSIMLEGRQFSPTEISALKVELRSLLAGRLNPPSLGNVRMSPDGTFTYTNLPVGEFKLTMSGMPPDLYLEEARLGSIDALTELLSLTSQPAAPLKITLRKGSTVNGVVIQGVGALSAKGADTQQVVLVPDGKRNRPDLYKTTTTDSNGRFALQGVAPGDYRAYAWKAIEPFQYFDSAFLRQFEDRSTAVRVTDEISGVVVTVIP